MKLSQLIFFLVFAFTATTQQLIAQDIQASNLTWTADLLTDLKTTSDHAYSCTFKTSSQGISWIQKNRNTQLVAQSVSGNWTNIASSGSIIFTVQVDGVTSSLKFERNQDGVFVTLDCTGSDPENIKYRFRISSVQLDQ